MPTLSSFISYGKALRKPKSFGIRRFEAPNSPHHPYASTDVVHITPTQSIQSYEEEEPEAQLPFQSPPVNSPPHPEEDFLSPQLTPIRPSTPPKKLDVELPSDSMSDWIPSHLLDERMYNGREPDQSPGAGSSKLSDERMITQEDVVTRVDRVDEETPDSESVYTDDENYSSTNDNHIVANLEAMDASSFVQTRDKLPPGAMLPFKKTAPTPIKIPNPSMHGPKVQVIRSSGGSKGPWHSGYTSSRPDSAHSGEEYPASAVSGTSLARALIGNSFVLSSDERASRYRSGGSVLTRTDSATLPRDENSFFYSPSYGNTPDHSLVPLPSNADSVYIPPRNPRRLSDRLGEAKRKRQSTGSLLLRNESEGETLLVRSNSTGTRPVSSPEQQARRISRISEADSSNHSIPDHTTSNAHDNEPLPSTSDSLYVPSPFLSPNPERLSNLSNVSSNPPPSTTSSGKEYDTMLDDYYSTAAPMTPTSPETTAGGLIPISMDAPHFRPPFSPISEESSSQLSPPTPYRRDSRRNTKGSGTGSPNGPRGTRAQQARLLPIGESSQPNGHNPPEPESASSLVPPPVFSLFNRQRSGSAPNPIKIVRDSQDLTSYNLISTTRPVSSSSSPTSSPEHEYIKQTFPETPHAFSPMWSAGSMVSPGMPEPTNRGSMDQILLAVPPTPLTATAEPMPALAQHMLARAASGARHSRQPSGTRVRTIPPQSVYSSMVPPPIPPDPEPAQLEEEESKRKRSYPSWVTQKFPTSDSEPSPSLKSDTHSPLDESVESPQSQPSSFQHYKEEGHHRQGSVGELSIKTEDALVNNSSQTSLTVRGLPALPPSPSVFGVSSFPGSSTSLVPPGPPQTGSSISLLAAPSSQDPHTPLPGAAASPYLPTHFQAPSLQQTFSQHPDNTPPSTGSSSAELEMGAPSIPSMGSPPPYYTLVFDQTHGHDNATPTSGESYRGTMSPNTPPSSRADSSRQSTSSIGGRRGRSRPPLPLGPRRPSHVANISQNGRQRNGSVSSINSNAAGGTSRLRSASSTTPHSPRFQTPAPKWRGYTMDAAKWTFTSAQLQDIVSRAIRQSAEASAIRLLRLETVDKDLPAELHKMELQRTDIKTRYKMLSRRRTELLTFLVSHTDGSKQEDPSAALRIVNELRDVSVMLDRLAEDLHSVDEQVSQLTSLRDVHDASALAMAIRKLNASFLKQLAVSDALRSQVVALEAERDDAWHQAEKVASDYDRLSEKMEDVSPSNRSSRVMAMRKSSIRVSKAGLRSTRSSMSSINRLSTASISGIKSAFSIEDIPPVPPIPRPRLRPHRPVDILTDLPSTRSFIALSTDGNTPNSETRAMARAHEELCDMLGIGHDFRPRRAQSVIGQTRVHGSEDQPQTSTRSTRSSTSTGRPLSMPDRSGLTEVYQSMSADGNAMLATLGLLSDVE